jgi:DnaJ family protein B protein 4
MPGGFPGFGGAEGFQSFGGGAGGPRFTFTTSGGRPGGGFGFMPGNPENIFANFAKMGGFEGEDDFAGIFGGGSPLGGGARFSRFGGVPRSAAGAGPGATNGARPSAAQPQREATVVEKPIAFTLEE